jgi:hypothetical protein
VSDISEGDLVTALDALHGRNRWRAPYRTTQGENMLREDMRRFLAGVRKRSGLAKKQSPQKEAP